MEANRYPNGGERWGGWAKTGDHHGLFVNEVSHVIR